MASTTSDHSGENRSVVLLGASGRLGAMLRAFWPQRGELICHSTRPHPDFIQFDLMVEPEKAAQAMSGARAVICLSGVTDMRAQTTGEVYSRNTDLALAAIRAAGLANAGRVFLASSAAVYGNAGGILAEDTPCQPVSAYARAKLAMEHAGLREGHPVTALRIGNVAGADAILGGWHDGMALDRFADGTTPRRSYIGPQTLARTLHRLTLSDDLPGILNLCAPGSVHMGALLDAAGLAWSPRPAPDTAIADVTLNTAQLENHATFAPENSTPAGLVAEWQMFRNR